MPALTSFEYSVIRVMPRVERGEFINVGVIVLCRSRHYLVARVEYEQARLLALFPGLDLAEIQAHLELIPRICAGGPAAGPIGQLSQTERFHWLVAPRSTIIQLSPAHSGLCHDPATALDRLINTMVRIDQG